MLTIEELCDELVDFGYSIKFKHAGGHHIIIWNAFDKYSGLSPVADVRIDKYNEYNLNYSCFKEELNTLEQMILASAIIQYARTPLEFRDI